MARAGVGSRRACEEIIRGGRVTVNGRTAVLGGKADPATDHIKVAVNEEYRPLDYKLSAGDEVVFIPPVSGG